MQISIKELGEALLLPFLEDQHSCTEKNKHDTEGKVELIDGFTVKIIN